jgi:hypothetical protein
MQGDPRYGVRAGQPGIGGRLIRTSLVATAVAMFVVFVLGGAMLVAGTGGMIIVVLAIALDSQGLMAVVLLLARGLLLVVPVSVLALPALALALRYHPRLRCMALLLAGSAAGLWWGAFVALLMGTGESRFEGIFAGLGAIAGLVAALVLVRGLRRPAAAPP